MRNKHVSAHTLMLKMTHADLIVSKSECLQIMSYTFELEVRRSNLSSEKH